MFVLFKNYLDRMKFQYFIVRVYVHISYESKLRGTVALHSRRNRPGTRLSFSSHNVDTHARPLSVNRGLFLCLSSLSLPLVYRDVLAKGSCNRVSLVSIHKTTLQIMAPPTYNDLGKSARNVFSQGYHFGLFKLDVKTKTHSDVEFCCGGVSNQDTGKVFGSLETKYKFKEYGLTFSEKWNTDNTLGTEVSIADKLLNGLTLGYSCTFSPQTGSKTGKLKTTYKHENVSATADFDLSLSAGPLIYASAVVGYQGWLGGYQASFDSQRNKLTRNNFALGFTASDFTLHSAVDNGREFTSSIYHKIKPDLEGAINLVYNSSNNVTQFAIGTKYNLDDEASIRAKVNSNLQIGLGYQQKLRDGVTLTLSTNIDGKNFGSGGHKYGIALDLQA